MNRMIELAPGFIIHTRPFQNTSALVDFFSEQHGLVSLVAKGLKRPRSRFAGIIQPFMAVSLSWVGKYDLKTLTNAQANCLLPKLSSYKILLGLYLNELIIRMLQRYDPYPSIYALYEQTLNHIASAQSKHQEESILRQFELGLLAELGYGLDFYHNKTGEGIHEDLLYTFDPISGMVEVSSENESVNRVIVSGATMISLRSGVFNDEQTLKESKLLTRALLKFHLENKPLQSRKLFKTYHEKVE